MKKLLTRKYFPYVMIFPTLSIFLLMFIYPVLDSFWLSLHITRGESSRWGGLANYIRLMGDHEWWQSLLNMVEILVIQVPIMLFIALLMASILNSAIIKMKAFFRISFFMPAITSLVAYALVFSMLLDNGGLLNSILKSVGLPTVPWLLSPIWAKVSLGIAVTWHWSGYNMIIFLAAMQDIPTSLYEAATIDGATTWQRFLHITMPLLKPAILFTTVLSTMGTLRLFEEPQNLTAGGPDGATESPTQLMYQVFNSGELGYSSTIAYGIVLIVVFITIIQFKFMGEK